MSSASVCHVHARLLARHTWMRLLPSVGFTTLIRHSSVLAQLMAHLDLIDSDRVAASTDNSLKSASTHLHRLLPSQRGHSRRNGSSCFCKTFPYLPTSKTFRDFRSEFSAVSLQQLPLSSRFYSSTSSLCYCHKSPTELQKSQRISRSEEEEEEADRSRDVPQRPSQLYQLIRTVLREEGEALQIDEKDPEHNIKRNIRPAVAGDPEVVTERLKELLRGVHHGNRAKLAEAITLIESKHLYKHKQAQWLLTKILSHQSKLNQLAKLRPTIRIGFSGPPGAGKSTLIESFGTMLTAMEYRVAVLAVDPSSSRTGGSILGDKTRMSKLSRDPNAYIRPTPSGGSLGGVARNTNEAIILCEAAGYDIILVETVGVGQSEIAVCDMVDMFVLIIPPAAGDELQGIKRGIVELADLVIVNKADGDLLPAARRIKAEYVSALKLLRAKHRGWNPKVLKVSALENQGMEDIWRAIVDFDTKMKKSGEFTVKRKQQQKTWMWAHIELELRDRFKKHPAMASHIVAMEKRVMAGSMAPGTAADILLDKFLQSSHEVKSDSKIIVS